MTEVQLYSDLRELIGGMSVNEVSNRQLRKYLIPASEWLADQLKYSVATDELAIALVADQIDYPLPEAVGWIIWVEWSTNKLDPNTTFGWEHDGLDWRDATSGSPTSFAIEGRKLLLNPPPSATAITTDGFLSMRYFSNSPGINPGGPVALSALDQQVLCLEAAERYLGLHPTEENSARLAYVNRKKTELMKGALARAHNPIEDFQEVTRVKTRRRGGAR
jgi:hypothetical protein